MKGTTIGLLLVLLQAGIGLFIFLQVFNYFFKSDEAKCKDAVDDLYYQTRNNVCYEFGLGTNCDLPSYTQIDIDAYFDKARLACEFEN